MPAAQSGSSEFNYWLEQAQAALRVQREEIQALLPFVERLPEPPTALRSGAAAELFSQLTKSWSWRSSLNDLSAALADGGERCEALRGAIGASGAAAQEQALAVSYVDALEQELAAAAPVDEAPVDEVEELDEVLASIFFCTVV